MNNNNSSLIHRDGLVLTREKDDTPRANIPHIIHHSPTGIEWGYDGSGPADLALSALHAWCGVPTVDAETTHSTLGKFDPLTEMMMTTERTRNGARVMHLVWTCHQSFKSRFIANIPRKGGVINPDEIAVWIDRQKAS